MPGLRSAISCTSSRHFGATNFSRGSRPGLRSSSRMSLQRVHAHRAVRSLRASTFSISSGLGDQLVDRRRPATAAICSTTGYDSGCTAVMSSGLLAAANAQESRRLLERLRPEARHRRQLHARAETPVLVAVLDDLLRRPLGDARHVAQQRPRRRIQIDADAVHAAFHRRFQALLQLPSDPRRADTGRRRSTSDRSSPAPPADPASAARSRSRRAPSGRDPETPAARSRTPSRPTRPIRSPSR